VRNDVVGLEQLYGEVEKTKNTVLKEVEQAIDGENNFELAAQKLRALLFIDKFCVELEEAISA
jgi:molecular chaperone HscB